MWFFIWIVRHFLSGGLSSSGGITHDGLASPAAHTPCIPGQYLPPGAPLSIHLLHRDGVCAGVQRLIHSGLGARIRLYHPHDIMKERIAGSLATLAGGLPCSQWGQALPGQPQNRLRFMIINFNRNLGLSQKSPPPQPAPSQGEGERGNEEFLPLLRQKFPKPQNFSPFPRAGRGLGGWVFETRSLLRQPQKYLAFF